jgi:hypothetical protein
MLTFCRGYDGAVNGSETDGSDLMDAGKKGAYPASVLENKRMIIFFQEQMRHAIDDSDTGTTGFQSDATMTDPPLPL